ncbi:hypothetical protein OG948_29660 [Embleya sp. NBC_00888]|uniref:hypothetical protein n=1 Tax=Embleya sp. NBC_00888 TaxID=2975960 RepID=UPI00386D00FA|nr:hypothetical protein OG948_29660 [Embleya sp. NBC_00888]
MAVELTKRRVPAEYVTRSVVQGRGWTQGAIARFLAEPDGTVANMRYRGSPPTRLYAMARVRAIEGTREWQEWYFASRRRRAATAERGSAAGGVVRGGSSARTAGAGGGTRGGGGPVAPGGGDVGGGVVGGADVGAERDAGVGRVSGLKGEVA